MEHRLSSTAIIKLAPVITAATWRNPEWERPGRDVYWSGSLVLLPRREVPLLVDHDDDRQVGVVRELSVLDWVDTKWIVAHVTINDPPGWLRNGTAASFERYDLHAPPMGEGSKRVAHAFVTEVSVALALGRACGAARSGGVDRPAASPAAATATAAGEVIQPVRAQRIVRHNIGQVIRVR